MEDAKHKQQWRNTIAKYCTPIIGPISVNAINTELVLRCLEPIWSQKPETATRIRSRIEIILNWAKVKGYRNGDNPARWRGHLDQLLPSRTKFAAVRSHASMPYASIPSVMNKLQERTDIACYALIFLILTASRTGEVRKALDKYRGDYNRTMEGKINFIEAQTPDNLSHASPPNEYHRLSVAWGLSVPNLNFSVFTMPGDIDDIDKKPVRDFGDLYVGPEQV